MAKRRHNPRKRGQTLHRDREQQRRHIKRRKAVIKTHTTAGQRAKDRKYND